MNRVFPNISKFLVILLACAVFVLGCGTKGTEDNSAAKKQNESNDKKSSAEIATEQLLSPEQAAKVVAKVGEHSITVGDVTRQINRLSPYIRRRWAAPEKRKEFLEKLIRVELLSQEAERLGLGDDAEVQRTVKQVMIRLLVKNDLEKEILPTEVDEKILKEEYDKESDKYHRPAQRRISQIVVATSAEATKLIAELKAKKNDARLFRQKAKELSTDEKTKNRGGDVGYLSALGNERADEPAVPKAVVEAVWKLENAGDVAATPIKSDQGFHVIKLTQKRPEMNRAFDSVKRVIENKILREKRKEAMDKYVESLRKQAKVETFAQNLEKIKIDTSAPPRRPGMMPPGAPKMPRPIATPNPAGH